MVGSVIEELETYISRGVFDTESAAAGIGLGMIIDQEVTIARRGDIHRRIVEDDLESLGTSAGAVMRHLVPFNYIAAVRLIIEPAYLSAIIGIQVIPESGDHGLRIPGTWNPGVGISGGCSVAKSHPAIGTDTDFTVICTVIHKVERKICMTGLIVAQGEDSTLSAR